MLSSKSARAWLAACLAMVSFEQAGAQEQPPPSTPGPYKAEDLKVSFETADRTSDYTDVGGPRSWYRAHFETIQRATPMVGCWVGGALASRAGSGVFLQLGTCVAGRGGFSTIATLINPLKEDVQPSAELDGLFANLPKRDASSAIGLLSGSLDASGRASRQQSLAQETKSRGAEIAVMKERQRQNSSIWGNILLGIAQGYVAVEAAKARSSGIAAMPSLGSAAGASGVTIFTRDANGRSQGQYQVPGSSIQSDTNGRAVDGSSQMFSSGKQGIANSNRCVSVVNVHRDSTVAGIIWYKFQNKCGFGIKVWADRSDSGGFLGLTDLKPYSTSSSSWYRERQNPEGLEYFSCPASGPEGQSVYVTDPSERRNTARADDQNICFYRTG